MTPAAPQERAADRAVAAAQVRRNGADGLFLPCQARVIAHLRHSTSLTVIEKSRRVGFTWTVAFFAAMKLASAKSAGGDDVFYMGHKLEMAREFIEDVAMFLKAIHGVAASVGESVFRDIDDEGNSREIKAYRIDLPNGQKCIALPSVPDAFRGMQGVVIIDEAGFHRNLAAKLKSAYALLMLAGQVIVISTHNGVANPFNQLINEIRAGQRLGTVFRITFNDAIAEGYYEKVARPQFLRKGGVAPTREEYIALIRGIYADNVGEELDVVPRVGGGSWIKPDDLAACEDEDAGKPELYRGGLYYMGRDVARRRDGAIIWGCELIGQTLWLRDRIKMIGASFAEQADAADWLFRHRRVANYKIDQGGMGEQPVEDAQRRYGTSRVQGEFLSGQNRLDLGISIRDRFERLLWRVPPHPEIRADLLAIKQLPSSGGAMRIGDDPDGDVHADEFWAGALASRGADMRPMEYGYDVVGGNRGGRGFGGGRGVTW